MTQYANVAQPATPTGHQASSRAPRARDSVARDVRTRRDRGRDPSKGSRTTRELPWGLTRSHPMSFFSPTSRAQKAHVCLASFMPSTTVGHFEAGCTAQRRLGLLGCAPGRGGAP
eukprot:scaffold111941_cov75-Phaeocystis_antarctica.AAC.1